MTPRTHGATAARRIPDPKVGGSNPSGFIPFCLFFFFSPRARKFPVLCFGPARNTASRAPLAERSAVNRQVLGSIPSGGALFFFAILHCFFAIAPVRVRALFFMPSAFYEIGGYTPVA